MGLNQKLFSLCKPIHTKGIIAKPVGILSFEKDSVFVYANGEYPGKKNKSRVSVFRWVLASWLLSFTEWLIR